MPNDMLSSVRSRTKSYGISTAAPYLRQIEQCFGGHCPSDLLKGVSEFRWKKALENAERQLVYNHPEMVFDGAFAHFDEKAASDAKLPPYTIASFPAVITTTRQDRDGDVLETKGAELDPGAPLLWQHLPFEPIGKLLKETKHTNKLLAGDFSICGTALGQDAAMLAEHGALDISHGFTTDDFEPLDEKEYEVPGFHVYKFKILEVSLVSIPSNPDAEITAFSRNKLHHPLVKALAGVKYDNRPVTIPVTLDVASLANSLPAGSTVTISKSAEGTKDAPIEQKHASCACQKHAGTTEFKGAVPYKNTPAEDEGTAWDASAAEKRMRSWAGVDGDEPTAADWNKFKQGFAFFEDEGNKLGDFKLPHHDIKDGKLVVVFKGCSAAIGALNGARGGGMKMSEADRKKVYNHLAKHYKDRFPDQEAPELKTVEPLRYKGGERDFYNPAKGGPTRFLSAKGVYVEFENSFGDIIQDLNDSLMTFLISNREADSDDYCYIVDLFLYQALVCVRERYGYGDDDCCYYLIDWEMGPDEEPVWTGAPLPVEVKPEIVELSERAYAMFVKSMPAAHLRKLNKAMGYCSKVVDHDEATDAVTSLATKAHDAIKSVHDAHEKDFTLGAEHVKSLTKAMGHLSKGMDHDEATDAIKGYFKSAHTAVKDVMDSADGMSGEESLETLVYKFNKAGRKISAANEKKLKAAASNFKAIADDDEADKDVSALAINGYKAVTDIFETGGDSANDYDAEGNYTGNDMHANMADGQSTNLPDGKAGRAVSKETAAKVAKAVEYGEAIVAHEKADASHKGLAKKAVRKLKSVLGEETPHEDADDNSMNLVTQDEPVKSLSQVCEEQLREGLTELALNGTLSALDKHISELTEASKRANDTISRIQRQRQYDAEEAAILSAVATV